MVHPWKTAFGEVDSDSAGGIAPAAPGSVVRASGRIARTVRFERALGRALWVLLVLVLLWIGFG